MTTIRDAALVEIRRDLHAYTDRGWTEFRTTALVAQELDRLGYRLHLGSDALAVEQSGYRVSTRVETASR